MKKGFISIVLVVVVVVVVVAGGFYLYSSGNLQLPSSDITNTSLDLNQGENMSEVSQPTQMSAKDMEMISSLENNANTLSTSLEDVSGGNSSGTAYTLRTQDKLWQKVTANLPEPDGNNVYEGWLVKKTPSLTFFSTGVMEKQSDGTYLINFMSEKLYEGYDFVVITLETVVDSTPEAHILEGTVN